MKYIIDSLEIFEKVFNSNEKWGEDLLEYRFKFNYKTEFGSILTFLSGWEVWDGNSRPYFYEMYNFEFSPEEEDEIMAVLWEDLYDAYIDEQAKYKHRFWLEYINDNKGVQNV